MRILIFIFWITLGVVYFFLWNMRSDCCINSTGNIPLTQPLSDSPSDTISNSLTTIPISTDSPINNSIAMKTNAPSENTPTAVSNTLNAAVSIGTGCIKFNWASSDPITSGCFELWKDSLLKSIKSGQVLELIGGYFEKENRIMAGGDLGLIRASKVKTLIEGSTNKDIIKIRSKNLGDTTGVLAKLENAISSRAVFMNDQVKELDEKTMIYFKFASNAGTNDLLVNQYVKHLAQKLKNTTDLVIITGHTDDDATAEHNLRLGLKRAEIIKSMLLANGIKGSRIKTNSRGEEDPIAPNDTEENRKQNRRVEVVITSSNQ